ncbi:MAG: hypothetical protein CVU96_05985 [Firmicutes bacterium HGW-Firmicutes-20]|jgi:hypothetical protein|nr:MAG: hypothetical protein CVU96_05985 [Firmicutes bacterium HGW-Firmicutes-20]PKM69338.1 MAG: hypothetical protein CVU94_04220 [Firmicutes bacterium HGW-Firmicutes-19]
MKTIRKITMYILILLLSGCTLALTPPADNDDDHPDPQVNVIGIWVQTNENQTFDLANARSLTYVAFQKKLIEGMPSSHSDVSGIFYDTNMNIGVTDEGTISTFTSTIPLKSGEGQILSFYTLIEDENSNIILGDRLNGYHSSNDMLANVNYSFTHQSTINGETKKDELHFKFQFSYHSPLESIRIIEMDKDYNVIRTYDFKDASEYVLDAQTQFTIIEQTQIDSEGQRVTSIDSYSIDDTKDDPLLYQYFTIDENGEVKIKTISIKK